MTERKALKRQPLHNRLQRIVLICIFTSLLITSIFSQIAQQFYFRSSLIEELSGLGDFIGNHSILALTHNDQKSAANHLKAAQHLPSVVRLCLYDTKNHLVSQYQATQVPYPGCPTTFDTKLAVDKTRFNEDTVSLFQEVRESDRLIGHLRIDGSLEAINRQTFLNLMTWFLSLLISTFIAYILSRRLLKYNLKPLHDLHKHTRTQRTLPFPPPNKALHSPHNDEIHDLIIAYKQMLQTISDEHNHLQISEARFRSLAENSPIGVYLQQRPEQITYNNIRWSEITHCLADTERLNYIKYIHPQDRELYLNSLHQLFREGQPATVEYRFQPPSMDGEKVLIDYLSPVMEGQEVTAMVGSVLDISDLKNAQQELEYLAFHDALTDLPNRRFFRDHLDLRIASAQKDGDRLTVLMIDLDNFKRVNDSMGHDAGDKLLSQVGKRLRNQIFESDVVSRLGGDEFIILLEHGKSPRHIDQIVEKLLEVIIQPLEINNQRLDLSCSIGVARYPEDALSSQDLIHHADIAMYQAKLKGKNCAEYFSAALNTEIQERIRLERKFRRALRENQLEIYIQPQYDLKRSGFYWGEALIRWHDPEEGFISPSRFIPIAEESGLVIELGQWVIRNVCQLLAENHQLFTKLGIDGLSINLSAQEFYHQDLVPRIVEQLNYFNVSPNKIEFELTESMVMEDVDRAVTTMQQLQKLGCRLALDDFGTGYSSLSYLKKFNINQLKIDKSFVDGLPEDQNDAAITGAILAMSSQLGLSVIAEGIETARQSHFLMARGCYCMQGYLYARPMSLQELQELVTTPKLIEA